MSVYNKYKSWPYIPEYLTEFLSGDILSIIQTGITHKEEIPLSICEFRKGEPTEFGPLGEVRSEFCNRYREIQVKGNERPGDILCKRCKLFGTAKDIIVNNRLEPGDYWCHMGIVELAAPIVVNGAVVAVLFGGQIIYEHMKEEIISNLNALAEGHIASSLKDKCIDGMPDINNMKLIPKSEIKSLIRLIRETPGHRKEDLERRKAILKDYSRIISDQASNIHRELKRGKEAGLFNRVAVLFENRDCNSIDEFRDVLSKVLETVNAFCGIKKSMLFTNHHSDGKDILKIFHMAASDACETPENIYLNMEAIKGPELHDFTCVTGKDVKKYLEATRHGLRRRDTQSIDFETVIRKGSENGISMAIAFGPREDAMPVTELIERELGFFQNLIFFLYSAINNKLTALDLIHKERLLQKKFVRLEQKVSDIAHEFKIRLQTIRTEADIWDMCCEKGLREFARTGSSQAYDNISSSIKDLSSYTNRALSGYSPEGFSLEGNAGELTDLSSFICWCANRYDSLVRKQSLSLLIDDTVNDLPEFLLDRDEFSCAMGNLIDNAVKYSMPGREIHIFAGFHEDTFSINISNFGIGVCEDEKTRVFERNYRGRSAMTALKSKGQGIGLSETREIVRRHGGDITIDSRQEDSIPGCFKTVVTVTLPYKQKERGNHDKYIVG